MRGFVPLDPEATVSDLRVAVVLARSRSRKRFPAACVEVVDSPAAALAAADPAQHRYAARVIGPSKSSEGQYLYYLVEWLEPG
jgi:hypothetical protein